MDPKRWMEDELKPRRAKAAWRCFRLAMLVGVAAAWVTGARAAGLLVADGGFGGTLAIEEHVVHVTVNQGIAVTTVEQTFRNQENRQLEALYTFPVPNGASVSNFSMWIHGKEMVGEVLEKERAREIYESYKRTRRDPGLLEQVDYKTFEMRIFPIAAGATQRVRLTYYQELDVDHDWATYVYPLATVTRNSADANTTGRFAMTVEVKSAVSIATMESPSHPGEFVVAKHADTYFQASLERTAGRNLDRDVVIAYHLSRPRTGIDLVTHKPAEGDGTFCLTLTAGEDLAQLDGGMDYVFVLDISGSMGTDGKLLVSKDSVSAFLNALGTDDRFELMTFNVQPAPLFHQLKSATSEEIREAELFLESQQARGGTALNPALTTAYKYRDPDRILNVVVLSDGMTEQSERATLLQLIRSRPGATRVFCIGVGNEVNRPLLEQMARDSGGLASFLSRGDDFVRQAQAFRRKLTHPVATGLSLRFEGVEVYDQEPATLPNLYHGTPVRVYGRYRGGGAGQVTLAGDVRGVALRQVASLDFPKQDSGNPEIERMWAWHRVDRLLKEADRAGSRSSVVDEVVNLGETYAIATEYTSFIVLENDAEYQRWKIERRNARLVDRDRKAQEVLQAQLDRIRDRAVAGLGPEAAREAASQTSPNAPPSGPATPGFSMSQKQASQAPVQTSRNTQSWDFKVGSGPVGPVFVAAAAWLVRRRRKRT